MKKCKIRSIKKIGLANTYNLTMSSGQHNYIVYGEDCKNGVISANSHSACYGFNSYLTAYLKANYPDEFACTFLSVEIERGKYDKMNHTEKNIAKECNIEYLPRDINKCKMVYTIEKKRDVSLGIRKTQIRPSILCKGVGSLAAEDIVLNQPYKNLRDLAERTDYSIVDTKSISSLAEAGYFGKPQMKDPAQVAKQFADIRIDLKKAAKSGVESVDIFA
jgi:DNA polymerase III subunit alpha